MKSHGIRDIGTTALAVASIASALGAASPRASWAAEGSDAAAARGVASNEAGSARGVASNEAGSARGVASTEAASGDEYSFNWLDPDKKIYVLQNRKYTKADRPELSLLVGMGLSNSYRKVYNVDPRFAYYFSEAWGIEGFYTTSFNSENDTFKALQHATTTLPVVREIRNQLGLMIHYVPWYAKINVFNKILYFDWYFAGGAGVANTEVDRQRSTSSAPNFQPEALTALYFATGHQYHLSQNLTVRLDLTGTYYRAPLFGIPNDNMSWFSNYNFGFGVGLRL
jgi:outer membrane beta-barrel protein